MLKKTVLVLLVLLSGIAQATDYSSVPYPKANYGTGEHAKQVARGEYLAKASDCIACHTKEGKDAQPFAGGLPIKTPFGTIYSPNITFDKETGIGKWSDDDFVTAVREGIAPDGSYYYPVFPFVAFNKFSRQDVLDIKAYLESLPPVRQKNLPLDMPFPFNIRLTLSFWRFMFFDFQKGEYQPDGTQSLDWNRGAYLVEGPGHCSLCHSPLNMLGSPKAEYYLSGGFVDGYSAPNINAHRLKNIPNEKIVAVFETGEKINGGQVQGPMRQVNEDSLKYLTKDDLNAIATYLKTVESKIPPAPDVGTGDKAGQAIYDKYCSGCHNMGSGGAPKFGDDSQWQPLVKRGVPLLYTHAIHGINGMPPKGNCDSCTDELVKSAVDYIIKQSTTGKGGSSSSSPSAMAVEATSLKKGEKVFNEVCSVCHKDGQLGAPRLGDTAVWTGLIKNNFDVLVQRALTGYKGHPAMGACYQCSDADVISAVKYMVQQSTGQDYHLW